MPTKLSGSSLRILPNQIPKFRGGDVCWHPIGQIAGGTFPVLTGGGGSISTSGLGPRWNLTCMWDGGGRAAAGPRVRPNLCCCCSAPAETYTQRDGTEPAKHKNRRLANVHIWKLLVWKGITHNVVISQTHTGWYLRRDCPRGWEPLYLLTSFQSCHLVSGGSNYNFTAGVSHHTPPLVGGVGNA